MLLLLLDQRGKMKATVFPGVDTDAIISDSNKYWSDMFLNILRLDQKEKLPRPIKLLSIIRRVQLLIFLQLGCGAIALHLSKILNRNE